MYDALIASDLHLGSDICQAKKLHKFLDMIRTGELPTRELILNGDVFESWDFRRLQKTHWKILSDIRRLSDKVHITWIEGNHDGPAEVVSHLLGVDVTEEYILFSGEQSILCLHGHQFDKFLTEHPLMVWIADLFYMAIQRVDKSFYLARLAKRSSKTFLRCTAIIEEQAMALAAKKACNTVCCGHTHLAVSKPGKLSYYNSGCWTELPCHYLAVRNGVVTLKEF